MLMLLGNTIFDIALALFVVVGVLFVGFFIKLFVISILERMAERSANMFDDALIVVVHTFGIVFYGLLGIYFALTYVLIVPEQTDRFIVFGVLIILLFYSLKAFFRVVDYVLKVYRNSLGNKHKELSTILPALGLFIKIIVFSFALIFFLSNIGVDITALIAGLGIGGLALAFAFQKILSDIFSTFVIFFDKPFSVGDAIIVNDISGTVEKVGIKTTHIRAFTGENVVVPNEDIVNSIISNTSNRPSRKVDILIPISYDVSKKSLDNITEIAKEIVLNYKNTDFYHAYIREFGEYAIMFELVYYINNATYDEHVSVRHSVHKDLLEMLQKKKIELGYPIEMDGRTRR